MVTVPYEREFTAHKNKQDHGNTSNEKRKSTCNNTLKLRGTLHYGSDASSFLLLLLLLLIS